MRTWTSPEPLTAADLNRIEETLAASETAVVQAAGDLVVAAGPGALQRLPVGSGGQRLVVVGGMPQWATLYVPADEDLIVPDWDYLSLEVYL